MKNYKFVQSKKIFIMLSKQLDKRFTIKKEFEEIIKILLTQFNTTIAENRFIVGGALEHFIVAVLNSIPKVKARHIGEETKRFDLEVEYRGSKINLSIKGIFSGNGTNLVNTRGVSSSIRWEEPTIFVVSGKGLYYGDPQIIPKKEIHHTADAITINVTSLEKLRRRDASCYCKILIPGKASQVPIKFSRVASREVAKQIIAKSCKILKLIGK
jgi:hypothetical protein